MSNWLDIWEITCTIYLKNYGTKIYVGIMMSLHQRVSALVGNPLRQKYCMRD